MLLGSDGAGGIPGVDGYVNGWHTSDVYDLGGGDTGGAGIGAGARGLRSNFTGPLFCPAIMVGN